MLTIPISTSKSLIFFFFDRFLHLCNLFWSLCNFSCLLDILFINTFRFIFGIKLDFISFEFFFILANYASLNFTISISILASVSIPALFYMIMMPLKFFSLMSNRRSFKPEVLFVQITQVVSKITFLLHFCHSNINIFFSSVFHLYNGLVTK